ncbi:flavodoxin domain-containing protein [Chloroflexota bacterium]
MSKVLIIYSSLSGNTEKMAKAVQEGAVSAGATVTIKLAQDATAEDVVEADAVIMGTPNFAAYMSGMMKDFFDRSLFGIRGKCDGKPYATFGSYGGGGEVAIETLNTMIDGLGLKKAFDNVGAQREPSTEALDACKALGSKMALV